MSHISSLFSGPHWPTHYLQACCCCCYWFLLFLLFLSLLLLLFFNCCLQNLMRIAYCQMAHSHSALLFPLCTPHNTRCRNIIRSIFAMNPESLGDFYVNTLGFTGIYYCWYLCYIYEYIQHAPIVGVWQALLTTYASLRARGAYCIRYHLYSKWDACFSGNLMHCSACWASVGGIFYVGYTT